MIEKIPREIVITVPYDGNTLEGLNKFLKRYHLDLDIDEESDYYEDLFYNADLRSFCGWSEEFNQLRMFPEYYAEGWEDSYWGRLKSEAVEFKIVRRN